MAYENTAQEDRIRSNKRWYSKYPAVVLRNDDPQMRGRIKVICPVIYGEFESPWAEYCGFGNGYAIDKGGLWLPDVGDRVWIECMEGDSRYPIFVGQGWVSKPEDNSEISELPREMKGVSQGKSEKHPGVPTLQPSNPPDVVPEQNSGDKRLRGQYLKIATPLKIEGFWEYKLIEPPSAYGAKYPFNRGFKTKSGHLVEYDDTPARERIHIFHKGGSYTEWSNGRRVDKTAGNLHTVVNDSWRVIVAGTEFRGISGSKLETVYRDYKKKVHGDHIVDVGGIAQITTKSYTATHGGDYTKKVQGSELKTITGNKKTSMMGSHSLSIGKNAEVTILEVLNEYIGNSKLKSNAFYRYIVNGNHKTEITKGSFKWGTLVGNHEFHAPAGFIRLGGAEEQMALGTTLTMALTQLAMIISAGPIGVGTLPGMPVPTNPSVIAQLAVWITTFMVNPLTNIVSLQSYVGRNQLTDAASAADLATPG